MLKMKKCILSLLAMLAMTTSFNLSIATISANQENPSTEKVSEQKSQEAIEEIEKDSSEEGLVSEENSENIQDSSKEEAKENAQKEHLGNEPPLISKEDDGSFKNVKTGESILSNRITYENPIMALSSAWISFGAGTGYYSRVTAADGVHMVYNANQPIIYVDGEVAFCVEPGIPAQEGGGYIPEFLEWGTIAIIAYEGWDMSDHSNEDYLATQFMIWEALGAKITNTNFYAYDSYKANIQFKVDHHADKPSFQYGKYELNVGESITIHDNNNALNKFQVYSNDGLNVKISGNDLIITGTANAKANATVQFRKIPAQYTGTSIAYKKPESQSIATFMIHDPIYATISVKTTNGNVNFRKYGKVFTHTLTGATESGIVNEAQYERKEISGAELTIAAAEDIKDNSGKVLYKKDAIVDVLESADSVIPTKSKNLPKGQYYRFESKVPDGFIGSLEKVYFEVTADGGTNQTFNVELDNDRPEQLLMFNKQLEKHAVEKYNNPNAYRDVVYGIFAREDINTNSGYIGIFQNEMVKTFIIDDQGNAKDHIVQEDLNADGIISDDEISYVDLKLNLPYAKYYAKELKTNSAYELDPNEYDFEVLYQGADFQNITLTINDGEPLINNLKDYEIQVNKVDHYTGKAILSKDFEFTAYTDADCTEVYKTVNANTLNGTAEFYLNYGEWWIKETKAPIGFLLSDEVKHLVINEEGVFVNDVKVEAKDVVYSFVYYNSMLPSFGVPTGTGSDLHLFLGGFVASAAILILLNRKKDKKRGMMK